MPRPLLAFLTGLPVALLGGLIGLGGAEFRLPILTGLFGYAVRAAIPLNLAVSFVTLVVSLFISPTGCWKAWCSPCCWASGCSCSWRRSSPSRRAGSC